MRSYSVFCAEGFHDCMKAVSDRLAYETTHKRVFGHKPATDFLTDWNFTIRRQALLRAPIIWC